MHLSKNRYRHSPRERFAGKLRLWGPDQDTSESSRTEPDVLGAGAANLTPSKSSVSLEPLEGRQVKVRRERTFKGILRRGGETKEVDMGKFASGRDEDELVTENLADCMGIAVVGDYDSDNKKSRGRFLVHVYRQHAKTYDPFEAAVEKALGRGLKITEVLVEMADPESILLSS
ncbi:Uu.00g080030.m01.CDS01 [Anthostomella pinea]|uniref:Uu.00g080030.m01.CDS01 n=1 Tax=Anthostomella pinea TaxID=933095 RepID=A0AAI8VLJ4_9PEZI|nr:Uu.00g080030.m01.CDS01 [Anthostomella pinea]